MVCIAKQRRKFNLGLHGYQLESFLSYGAGHLSGRQKIGKGGTIKVILAVYLFNHEAHENHEDNKNIKKNFVSSAPASCALWLFFTLSKNYKNNPNEIN